MKAYQALEALAPDEAENATNESLALNLAGASGAAKPAAPNFLVRENLSSLFHLLDPSHRYIVLGRAA